MAWCDFFPRMKVEASRHSDADERFKEAADLLVEASELLARSGQVQLAAEVRNIVERLELVIPKAPA